MAAAAVVARAIRRKQGGERRGKTVLLQDFEKELSLLQVRNETFDRYDEKKSGALGRAELIRLLADLTPSSAPPTEEEMDFLIEVCEEGGSRSGTINRRKLDKVLLHWSQYLKIRDRVQAALESFEESDSGRKLERWEVKEYLTELNAGIRVSEDDVDWLLAMAKVQDDGTCGKPDLIVALAKWYQHSPRRREATCCVIS